MTSLRSGLWSGLMVAGLLAGVDLAAAADPELRITGEVEVVYDWSADRCRNEAIPDLAARAFRDAEDRVQLIVSHTEAIRMIGPNLDAVEVACDPVSRSAHNADPSLFSDAEWIAAPYTEDGMTVYALVHNEHHGHDHDGQCPSGDYFKCWYNSVTLAVSVDGGASYRHAADPPGHLVASFPAVYEPDGGTYGMFTPSNIIRGPDGYYYAFVKAQAYLTRQQFTCLMRTAALADPGSWRYWDGESFAGVFVDPYRDDFRFRREHTCRAIASNDIGQMTDSVTYNSDLDRYVLVGVSADSPDGEEVWGFYYAFSDDLIHWTRRRLLKEVPLPWTVTRPQFVSYLYPALLDPESPSRNFEATGRTAYLYYTRNNLGHTSLDRDLVRVPVAFFDGK